MPGWHGRCSTGGVVAGTRSQLSGSPWLALLAVLPFATGGCAIGRRLTGDDEGEPPADASEPDTALPVEPDAAVAACAIAAGLSPALDGVDDIAKYPAAQQVTPGAMLGTDAAALAWDRDQLYVTVTSSAFTGAYEPLHVYVETAQTLSAPTSGAGREYGGLTPALPFTPTHVIAVRRVSDSGTGGPYDGVYTPDDGWMNRAFALDPTTFSSADQKTLSVRVPWSALGGCPSAMRLALHVVHGQVANEWKDLVPSTHTPWQSPGGGYYEIDLTGELAVSAWTLR